ncbi:hypothetical protein KQI42_09770 [Tissierella sp. MSJ-40]|uniref:Head decoration protein n=1 Tax=Tissierella simiarum TaxID=2841534 RepID=A0ABS6E689_9FIRM|nr:hypothetical protein [Tissierella simiarum]MBU5438297.1 hypothetical protein [Tissierella simiarum]
MFEIDTAVHTPKNFFAGDFPIVTDSDTIKKGAVIRKYAPITKGETGIEEVAGGTLANLLGIAADEPNGGKIVYYLTGEFFADAITLPDGVTIEELKTTCRKLGIFLK